MLVHGDLWGIAIIRKRDAIRNAVNRDSPNFA